MYSGDRKSLFLTCEHNFGKVKNGEYIRLYHGQQDYPIAKMLQRSGDDEHDTLLFSVEFVPKDECLEFFMDEVKKDDSVVILECVNPDLRIKNKLNEATGTY